MATTEESLVTLREIADELGVHYRTIIDYKNHFKDFIALKYDGQGMRYPARYTDLFRLIIAMREEGYSLAVVRMILSGQVQLADDHHLSDWLAGWQDGEAHPRMSGCIQPSVDGGIHPSVDGGIHPSEDGGIHPSEDGGIHPSVDVAKPTCHHFVSHLHATTTALTTLATTLNQLQENTGHQQQYLAALNTRLASLEHELGIESDTPQSPPEAAEVPSIDLDNLLQPLVDLGRELESEEGAGEVRSDDATAGQQSADSESVGENSRVTSDSDASDVADTTSDPAAATPSRSGQQKPSIPAGLSDRVAAAVDSLATVRDSISNGKPDKRALLEWIDEQRQLQPTLSYTAIASVLDQAGVPTLSGRQGWHRGSVRNLVAKNGG